MAYYDRDYYRPEDGEGGGRFFGGRHRISSYNTWIMIVCVAIFVIGELMGRFAGANYFLMYGYFSADTAIKGGQIWRFLTFQFLHGGLGHIFFNMLGLYFFGPMVEAYLGSKRYLAFYLLCGIGGAVGYIVLWQLHVISSFGDAALVGASAGVFGVLIGAARIAPNHTVMLLFPPIPMKLRTMAWGFVGVEVFMVLAYGDQLGSNSGGSAAHLGGAVLGYFLIKHASLLNVFAKMSPSSMVKKHNEGAWKRKVEQQKKDEAEIDRILAKVSEKGLQSLTRGEKRMLQQATEAKRGH